MHYPSIHVKKKCGKCGNRGQMNASASLKLANFNKDMAKTNAVTLQVTQK